HLTLVFSENPLIRSDKAVPLPRGENVAPVASVEAVTTGTGCRLGHFSEVPVDDHRTDRTGQADGAQSPGGAIRELDPLSATEEDAPPTRPTKSGQDHSVAGQLVRRKTQESDL